MSFSASTYASLQEGACPQLVGLSHLQMADGSLIRMVASHTLTRIPNSMGADRF